MPSGNCKSVPVGGIVAGAVVGTIAIVAILVLGWYLVNAQKMRTTLASSGYMVEAHSPQNAGNNNDMHGAPSPMIGG